jgi:hypothetical protein
MSSSRRTGIIKGVLSTFSKEKPISSLQLRQAGVSNELAYRYVKSGWLKRFERGTFGFMGDELNQVGSLEFLAERYPGLHIGGKTALAWRGLLHNVPFQETLCLWGPKDVRIPAWFRERFPCRYTSRLLFEEPITQTTAISNLPDKHGDVPVSEPERAMLELLSEVGTHQEVGEARNIVELLGSLRVESLLPLLTHCRQTKAARLCVQWAAELGLPWATQAAEAIKGVTGGARWVRKLACGHTLILKGS